jgi:hypothetical protein
MKITLFELRVPESKNCIIKEQREICISNGINFKFRKISGEWFIFVTDCFVGDLTELGYSNVKSLNNY